ncbi:MAG: trypsin-like serine protease, partial [Deltaproteobacteria bacterium]|nr:trypsin-like serine protease [Deltaproteobacteria bacterium]
MAPRDRSCVLRALSCGMAIACAAACGVDDLAPVTAGRRPTAVRSVFYGHASPTLYPDLSAEQQNAVVQLYAPAYGQGFCTGTLVSPHVVLTAAHCIQPPGEAAFTASDIVIRIGPDSSDPLAELTLQRVAHRDWEARFEDDVGIAILGTAYTGAPPFEIKRGGTSTVSGQQAQAVGFGMTEDDDPYFPTNTRRYWTTLDVEWVEAAGIVVNGHGSTGVAPGDSGSPLLYDFGSGPQVVGIASTSEEGWVYSANYTNVETQESYIQQFVDQYDDPACVSACAGAQCGEIGGCSCGSCDRGFECQNQQCQEIPAGSGGVCATLQSVAEVCNAANPCPPGLICL